MRPVHRSTSASGSTRRLAARDRADVGQGPAAAAPAPAAAHGVRVPDAAHPLTGKYTFDMFVIGATNRFAHAAALAVAEAPAQSYNPLFIYGARAWGKPICCRRSSHYLATEHPTLRVRYVTTEAFMNEFVDSMRDRRIDAFKHALPHLRRPDDRRHPVLRG